MKRPTIGELSKLVHVRAWQDVPDAAQGIDQTFGAPMPAWARMEPAGSALFYGLAQVESGITHRAAMWRTPQLNADLIGGSHVVEYAGLRYRVRRATDMNGHGEFLLLDLEQLGAIAP